MLSFSVRATKDAADEALVLNAVTSPVSTWVDLPEPQPSPAWNPQTVFPGLDELEGSELPQEKSCVFCRLRTGGLLLGTVLPTLQARRRAQGCGLLLGTVLFCRPEGLRAGDLLLGTVLFCRPGEGLRAGDLLLGTVLFCRPGEGLRAGGLLLGTVLFCRPEALRAVTCFWGQHYFAEQEKGSGLVTCFEGQCYFADQKRSGL
jgi:hypothetical protein